MHQPADPAVARSSSLSARTGKSLQSLRAWLDQGADTSRGTPCEPLRSAFRWAEESHGDDELLSMLRASAAAWSRWWPLECEHATTGAARCGRPLSQHGRRVWPKKRSSSSSSSIPKVLAVQHRNVCAQVGGDDRLSFSDFWFFGADDRRSRSQCCGGFGGPERRLEEAKGHLGVRRLLHFYSASRCGRG